MSSTQRKKKVSALGLLLIGAGGLGATYGLYKLFFSHKKGSGSNLPDVAPGGAAVIGACSTSGLIDPRPAGLPALSVMNNPADLQAVFSWIKDLYGPEIARNVEKIYRLETANFNSGQYLNSGSAGMIGPGAAFPYGWSSLIPLWSANPAAAPIGKVRFCVFDKTENKYKIYSYLVFSGGYGFLAVAEIMKLRGNYAGSWNSSIAENQIAYQNIINTISSKYV